MPGPAKTPTVLTLLKGNPGHRPINKDEPKPEIEAPPCPDFLSLEASEEWGRIVPHLVRLGLLSQLDMAALALYCAAYGRLVVAERALRKEEADNGEAFLVEAADGPGKVKSRWLTIARQAADESYRFLQQFGLSPASRSKVVGNSAEPPKGDSGEEARWNTMNRAS
jgi:P27 family predicted phage terminase small subunit